MQNFAVILLRIVCLLCVLILTCGGCRKTEETVRTPMVVVKKISIPTSPPPAARAAEPLAPEVKQAAPQPAPATGDESGVPSGQSATPAESASNSAEIQPPVYVYDPEGKVNPFMPLIGGIGSDSEEIKNGERKKRIPLTPLEKIDLSQLKLAGIIRAKGANKALVEESSGKGYIIVVGTFIGIHSGKVTDILKDRVIVEEEFEDIPGKVVVRKREMKLQKPPGEE
ncbi:MAG: pilus assembly protein PilP [Desulfobacterales bacterium]|nr:pilus assembly protein PilP [Desulfobacterales bacterium]